MLHAQQGNGFSIQDDHRLTFLSFDTVELDSMQALHRVNRYGEELDAAFYKQQSVGRNGERNGEMYASSPSLRRLKIQIPLQPADCLIQDGQPHPPARQVGDRRGRGKTRAKENARELMR